MDDVQAAARDLYDRIVDDWREHGGVPVETAYEPGTPVIRETDRLPDDFDLPWYAGIAERAASIYRALRYRDRDHHKVLDNRHRFDTEHFSPFADASALLALDDYRERWDVEDDAFNEIADGFAHDALNASHTTTLDVDTRGTHTVFPYIYNDELVDDQEAYADEEDLWQGGNAVLYSQDTLSLTLQALERTRDTFDHGDRLNGWSGEVLAQDYDALWRASQVDGEMEATHDLTYLDDIDDGAVLTFVHELTGDDRIPNGVDPVLNAYVHDAGFADNEEFLRRVVTEQRFDEDNHFYYNPLHALARLRRTLDDDSLDHYFLDTATTLLGGRHEEDLNPVDSAALLQVRVGSDQFGAPERRLLDTVTEYVEQGADERDAFEVYRAKVPRMTYFGGETLTDVYLLDTLNFLMDEGVW